MTKDWRSEIINCTPKNDCKHCATRVETYLKSVDEFQSLVIKLNKENSDLKKIIAKEVSENDEFGSEFVIAQILRDKLSIATEFVKQRIETIKNVGSPYGDHELKDAQEILDLLEGN